MSGVPFPRILVAVDDSGPSRAAIAHALRLAKSAGGRLIFSHAIDAERVCAQAAAGEADAARLLDLARRDGADLLDAVCEEAHALDLYADLALVEGSVVEAILASAHARQVQLIVIGTHGRTGLPRWTMGSVAERVVRRAECPVLTVHEPETERVQAGA